MVDFNWFHDVFNSVGSNFYDVNISGSILFSDSSDTEPLGGETCAGVFIYPVPTQKKIVDLSVGFKASCKTSEPKQQHEIC